MRGLLLCLSLALCQGLELGPREGDDKAVFDLIFYRGRTWDSRLKIPPFVTPERHPLLNHALEKEVQAKADGEKSLILDPNFREFQRQRLANFGSQFQEAPIGLADPKFKEFQHQRIFDISRRLEKETVEQESQEDAPEQNGSQESHEETPEQNGNQENPEPAPLGENFREYQRQRIQGIADAAEKRSSLAVNPNFLAYQRARLHNVAQGQILQRERKNGASIIYPPQDNEQKEVASEKRGTLESAAVMAAAPEESSTTSVLFGSTHWALLFSIVTCGVIVLLGTVAMFVTVHGHRKKADLPSLEDAFEEAQQMRREPVHKAAGVSRNFPRLNGDLNCDPRRHGKNGKMAQDDTLRLYYGSEGESDSEWHDASVENSAFQQ